MVIHIPSCGIPSGTKVHIVGLDAQALAILGYTPYKASVLVTCARSLHGENTTAYVQSAYRIALSQPYVRIRSWCLGPGSMSLLTCWYQTTWVWKLSHLFPLKDWKITDKSVHLIIPVRSLPISTHGIYQWYAKTDGNAKIIFTQCHW